MSCTEKATDLIATLRELNEKCSSIMLKNNAQYLSTTYQAFAKYYRAIKELTGTDSSLFLIQLASETTERQYGIILIPLKKELSYFCEWYDSATVLINELFSYEHIAKSIESEVDFKYKKIRQEAEDDFHKIYEDEIVWHNLANAYGSKCPGGKDERTFTDDDWDYIQGSLSAFKKHFQVNNVNLERVYEEFSTKIKPRWKECRRKRDEVYEQCDDYRRELAQKYEDDVFIKIYWHLHPLITNLSIEKQFVSDSANLSTNKRYGEYDCLKDCLSSEDVYNAVKDLADIYYKENSRIDGKFGICLLTILRELGVLHKDNCTEAGFGDLLIKEFSGKCSFKKGEAISDAKIKPGKEGHLKYNNFQEELSTKLKKLIKENQSK